MPVLPLPASTPRPTLRRSLPEMDRLSSLASQLRRPLQVSVGIRVSFSSFILNSDIYQPQE